MTRFLTWLQRRWTCSGNAFVLSAVILCCGTSTATEPVFKNLFNGKNLQGWKGLNSLWSVQDGVIIGQTIADRPIEANTFLIWQGGEVGDFELIAEVRFEGNNSGIQYRSELVDEAGLALAGYQADLHPKLDYMGMMYGEKTGRGIIANGGQRVAIDANGKTRVVDRLSPYTGTSDGQWNELRIVAVGNRMIHQINGITTVDVTDDHPDGRRSGLLGLQLHRGPAMKAEFRDLRMRSLAGEDAKQTLMDAVDATKTIALSGDSTKPKAKKAEKKSAAANSDSTSLMSPPLPLWIWTKSSAKNQKAFFRQTFDLTDVPQSASVFATCDNRLELFINGESVGASPAWQSPLRVDVTARLKPGRNVVAVAGRNEGGTAALVLKLSMALTDGSTNDLITDGTWKVSEIVSEAWTSPTYDDSDWISAKPIRSLGGAPWGVPGQNTNGSSVAPPAAKSLDVDDIEVPPGFAVEQVYLVPPSQGSWVSMTTDPQGRIYACDQAKAGLYRLTLREGKSPLVEKVSTGSLASLSGAQGLEWAFDGLWFHTNGGNLIRVTDSDGDDVLDTMETYPGTTAGGEHGNHAVLKTEDGKALYLDAGNGSSLAETVASRVPTWSEGLLLPRMWDARGHARGRMAPGGWITRVDPESGDQTVHSIGYRNQYDIALNRHGDLFTYDADMEWDFGLPWYRPTRICLACSGSDYGWRSGAEKWPTYYEDSLPPVVEIGPGSPTGLLSGARAAFPTKYQGALFALDWTYGTIYAIHLIPEGAGYRGQAEPFATSSPLPLTDAVIAHDGTLVFSVGGRGTTSGLYRIRYIGGASLKPPTLDDEAAAKARDKRRALEQFHGRVDPSAVASAWPFLSSKDRFLRHAARIAIESQPVKTWADRVLLETNPQARITATVALARMGSPEHQAMAIEGLLSMKLDTLSESETLGLLRAYALVFIELGKPTQEQRDAVAAQLNPRLPSSSADINRELVRVLTYLQDGEVVAKAMALIDARQAPDLPPWSDLANRNARYGSAIKNLLRSHPPSRELALAYTLRLLDIGWTLDQRRSYFTFLNEAAKASGGASYAGYLTRIRDEALATCSADERVALQEITGEDFNPVPDFPITEPVGPGQSWTVPGALASLRGKADFERGRSLYFSAKCAACHRLQGLGGDVGPDLTSVRNKFDEAYLVEAIIHPSKNISDQYGSSRVLTDEGQVMTGLVIEQDNGDLMVYPIDQNAKSVLVPADRVELIEESKISQMPEELLNRLSGEEVRDLVTYIMSGGDAEDKLYGKR